MSRSIVIKSDEYEFYQIKIPFALLGEKKQKKYISAELDKRHPCFCDDFCFDVQVDFNKSGFLGNVVVINKNKLADIRKSNPHKRLKISERKLPVFDIGIKGFVKRNLFCSVVFAVVFAICICCVVAVKTKEKQMAECLSEVQTENKITNVPKQADVNRIFEVIADNKGKITRLEWKLENQTEIFTVSVNHMYPENFIDALDNITVSAVSYSKNIPLMVVKTNGFCSFQKDEFLKQIYFVPLVRNVLKANNCTFKEEDLNRLSFTFMWHEAESKNVVLELAKVLQENSISISSVVINYDGKSIFDVQLELVESAAQIIDMELVAKNLNLFINDNSDLQPVRPVVIVPEKKSPGKKLGEVIYSDGSKTVFYKSDTGKTIKVKEFVHEKDN